MSDLEYESDPDSDDPIDEPDLTKIADESESEELSERYGNSA